MSDNQDPIELIDQLKNDGFFVEKNEFKVRLVLYGLGKLMEDYLSSKDKVDLESIKLYATGVLSKEELDQISEKYWLRIKSNDESKDARAPLTCNFLLGFNETAYHDYLGYSIAYCRQADNSIPDSVYYKMITGIFYE